MYCRCKYPEATFTSPALTPPPYYGNPQPTFLIWQAGSHSLKEATFADNNILWSALTSWRTSEPY